MADVYDMSDELEGALSDNVRSKEEEKYLVFRSSGILYGVNADNVVEILTDTSVTTVPLLPAHISGVINMRGLTVPIINFRLMLGQPPLEDQHCTIVLEIDGTQIGVQADDVDQMVDIAKNAILPVPSQNSQRMVTGMYTLPGGGTVMVLDCMLLLHE